MSVGQNSFQEECTLDWFKYLTILETQISKSLDEAGKYAKISFILSKLDISFLTKDLEAGSKFSADSIVKMHLLKRVKGITRFPALLKYLRTHEEEALQLGFFKDESNVLQLPAKRTFNEFFQKKISKEMYIFLEQITEEILALATKKGIILDLDLIKKEAKKEKRDNSKVYKEAVKLVKKLVYPEIKIKMRHNAKFTTKDLLDVLVHVAQTHDFCNNGSKTFKELNPNAKVPHGDTLTYHFRKFKNKKELDKTFRNIFDVIFDFAKKNYSLLRRRQLNIAIDIHDIPYYGDKNDDYVMEGKKKDGTTHFFKFITCSIVVAGRRFTIDAILMHKLDDLEDLVDKLIKRAKQKINVDKAYLDRGFDKPKVINILKANRIKFIMPKIKSATVKAWMDKSEACKSRIIKDFEIGTGKNKAIVDLVLVDNEEGIKRAFAINFHIPEQLTHYLFKFYSKRWGIETGYRNLEQDFKPRTTSKNYIVRLFYFLFSTCLYNLWVLTNICISLTLYGRLPEKPILTAKLFTVILYRVSCEDPPT